MTRAEILSKRIELLRAQLREPEASALEVLANDAVRDGWGRSGPLVMGRHERRLDTLQRLLKERIRLEKEQGLAPEDETTWQGELVGSIHGIIEALTGAAR